jgi:sarcosine oxidase
MEQNYDVVIVGGAIVGSAVAYFLAAEPAFDGTVLVVERDPSYEFCSTTRSWGGIRFQFTTPECIAMSLYGADFVRGAAEHLSTADDPAHIPFAERGYLMLLEERNLEVVRANHELQEAHGGSPVLLGRDELAARFPALNLDGVAAGSSGAKDEGWIDPSLLLNAFRAKARELGVSYVKDEVVGLRRDGGHITGAVLRDGGAVACGTVVNAAGMHAAKVAEMAGCALPVGPHKVQTYVFECRDEAAQSHPPLTIDVSGLVFRHEGGGRFATVMPPGADEDAHAADFEVDYDRFEARLWPILAARVPAFEAIKLTSAWGGHYDYNHFDQNAILGPHPEIAGLMFANGFSGHGIQHAPSAISGAKRSLCTIYFVMPGLDPGIHGAAWFDHGLPDQVRQ